MRPLILMMVVMLHDDHRLEVTLHPSIFFFFIKHHLQLSLSVIMRINTGQLVLVTLWTGQQSGAAPCRSSVGFSSPFYPLLKSTVLAVEVQFRSCGWFASVPSLCRRASRLTRCAARSQPGGVRGSEPAAARLLQRHRRGGKREEVSLWRRIASSQLFYSCMVIIVIQVKWQHLISSRPSKGFLLYLVFCFFVVVFFHKHHFTQKSLKLANGKIYPICWVSEFVCSQQIWTLYILSKNIYSILQYSFMVLIYTFISYQHVCPRYSI